MGFEYRLWAKSAVWTGDIENPALPPVSLADGVIADLLRADPQPPFQGTVRKMFPDLMSRFFFDFDNKVLDPEDARSTGVWLNDWAERSAGEDRAVQGALICANWLQRAAADGWFVDWTR